MSAETSDQSPTALGVDGAFPLPSTPYTPAIFGLSKRELFAAMAMQGLLGNPNSILTPADCAQEARIHADALLKELAK